MGEKTQQVHFLLNCSAVLLLNVQLFWTWWRLPQFDNYVIILRTEIIFVIVSFLYSDFIIHTGTKMFWADEIW
jgi:hypothetical protein